MHRLVIAGLLLGNLPAEALRLIVGIVQLGEAVGDLAPGDEQLEAVGHERVLIVAPGER